MKKRLVVVLVVGILLLVAFLIYRATAHQPATTPAVASANLADTTTAAAHFRTIASTLPIRFEANQGQADAAIDFLARGPGYHLALLPNEAILRLPAIDTSAQASLLRMRLVGANPNPAGTGQNLLAGKSNYLLGKDPSRWHSNVLNYSKVAYKAVYPGIDVVYYGNPHQLEYDFIVAPGADPNLITLDFDGTERMTLDETGHLVLHMNGADIVQHAPVSYQDIDGTRHAVASRYVRKEEGRIGFEIGDYDPNAPLVIDPEIVYSTYLSGDGADQPRGLVVDNVGNRYLVGETSSTDFPTVNPIQDSYRDRKDLYIVKMNAQGTALIYATYLGGDGLEEAAGIGIDAAGNVYIAGSTDSENFPTKNAAQPSRSAGSALLTKDAFVAALNASGSDLIYATYLGGSNDETTVGMGVDDAGNAYIAGRTSSSDLRLQGAFQNALSGSSDLFVARFTPSGGLSYSTYLGGSGTEEARGMGVDGGGNAFIVGRSGSANFPLRQDIAPFTRSGGNDGFVTKLTPNGQPTFASFFGFFGYDVALDAQGQIYVWGDNRSTQPTPTVNAFQSTPGDANRLDGFLVKLNATANTILMASYLGGSDLEQTNAIVLDAQNNVYLYGITRSADFPVKEAVQPTFGGDQDMFLAKVTSGGTLEYATYLGGSRYEDNSPNSLAVDASGTIHFAFETDSGSLPTGPNAFQTSGRGATTTYVGSIGEGGKNILVQDWRLNPMANAMMKVFIVHSLAPYEETQLGEIITDEEGKATLPGNWFKAGDHVKLTRVVHTEPAIKADHEAVDNTAYTVSLDNANVNLDGLVIYPESEDVPEQTFLMNHTTVLFNLVVSVEWDAPPEYLNSIVEGLRQASNYLYDVTNAQLRFNKVAIYDDKQHWDEADVLIHASNQEWPRANVFGWKQNALARTLHTIGILMPRQFSGDQDANRALDVNQEPTWNMPTTFRTLAHEFGHYGLGFGDEYQDEKSVKVLPGVNLGFMDSQYAADGPLASEMSSEVQYRSADWQVTAQWARRGMSCWDFFIQTFEIRENSNLIAPLYPPPGSIRVGPNDNLSAPDIDIGSLMERFIMNEAGGAESRVTRFTHPTLQQKQGITVRLEKTATGRTIDQGKTNKDGYIRLLGTHPGDEVFAYVKVPVFGSLGGPSYESLIANLSLSEFSKVGQDTLVAALRRIAGNPTLINTLAFLDQNSLRFQARFQDPPPTTPELEDDGTRTALTPTSDGAFTLDVDLPASGNDRWTLWTTDPDNEAYFIDQSVAAFDLTGDVETDQIASADGGMEAIVNADNNVQRAAVLTSTFPTLRNGLPDIAEQAGDVHTLALFPAPGTLQNNNSLLIRYLDSELVQGSESSIRIFRWNPDALTWQPVGGSVDTGANEVVAPITQAGTYAAFTTETGGSSGQAPGLAQVSPANAVQGATGVQIALLGQNFQNGATVSFSGTGVTATNVTRRSSTELQITISVTASAPSGRRDITVTNPDGLSITATGAFEVLAQGSLIALLRWDPPAAGETLIPPDNLRVDFGNGTTMSKQGNQHHSSYWLDGISRVSSTAKGQRFSRIQTVAQEIDEIEPNNHPDNAQVLTGTAPLTINGNAEIDDEGTVYIDLGNDLIDDFEDLFRITITEPGLVVALEHFISDMDIYLIDEQVNEVLNASVNIGATEPELIEDVELPVGTYFIGVSIFDPDPIGGPTTPYTLTVLGTFEGGMEEPPTLLSYNIYRSLAPNPFSSGTRIASVDATTTTYMDALPSDGMYHYQVTAVYDQGESDPSEETVLSVAVDVEQAPTVPATFALAQNYPNPFNPITTIPYTIDEPGRVTLRIFNVLGQHVQTLVDGYHVPGRYQVPFNATGLPSGLYMYQLEAGSQQARKTMLLLK